MYVVKRVVLVFTGSLPPPKTLQEVQIPIVSNYDCISAYRLPLITDNMICAGQKGKDSCQARYFKDILSY